LSHIVEFTEILLQDLIPYFSKNSAFSSTTKLAISSVDLERNDTLRSEEFIILEIPEICIISPLTE